VHGSGYENWSDDDLTLVFSGTRGSGIASVDLSIDGDGCTSVVTAYKS
jgi:hypothetical protein